MLTTCSRMHQGEQILWWSRCERLFSSLEPLRQYQPVVEAPVIEDNVEEEKVTEDEEDEEDDDDDDDEAFETASEGLTAEEE